MGQRRNFAPTETAKTQQKKYSQREQRKIRQISVRRDIRTLRRLL